MLICLAESKQDIAAFCPRPTDT